MQSHFTSQTIAEIFRDLYLSERTGALTLTRGGLEKRIYFERGLIYYAESTEQGEELGPRLVEEGRLSRGGLNEARDSVQDPRDVVRALIQRELIGRQTLAEVIQDILRRVLQSVFRWEGGTSAFTDGHQAVKILETDVLRTFGLILRGIFATRDFDPIQEAMLALDNRLRLRKPSPIPLERVTLSPSHGFILSRVDGSTTIREVLSLLPHSEEELALKFLFGLLVMGVLEFNPPLGDGPFRVANILRDHADSKALEQMQERTIRDAEKQMRQQNPYQILGVDPSAGSDAIERAYEESKALFSRERILPRVRDQYRSELAVIESRLIEAYLTLSQPAQQRASVAVDSAPAAEVGVDDLLVRVEMDKTKSKLAAEKAEAVADSYYDKAVKAKRESDFHNAIQYGKLAISYDDSDARFYKLLADCQLRNPGARWQHMAEENLTKAIELDPWNAEYWVGLGRFYKKRGLLLRARKQFEEALKVVPNHDDATAELEALS